MHGWPLDLDRVGGLVADTVRAVWDGRAESGLAEPAGAGGRLSWRQVAILRAYRQYRQVLGGGFINAKFGLEARQLVAQRYEPIYVSPTVYKGVDPVL